MAFARFKTLKRDQHRHGRVACLLDIDVPRKKLIFNLLEARGLDAGFSKDRSTEDVYIQFRVQLLPANDPVKVHKVNRNFRVLLLRKTSFFFLFFLFFLLPEILYWSSEEGCCCQKKLCCKA